MAGAIQGFAREAPDEFVHVYTPWPREAYGACSGAAKVLDHPYVRFSQMDSAAALLAEFCARRRRVAVFLDLHFILLGQKSAQSQVLLQQLLTAQTDVLLTSIAYKHFHSVRPTLLLPSLILQERQSLLGERLLLAGPGETQLALDELQLAQAFDGRLCAVGRARR